MSLTTSILKLLLIRKARAFEEATKDPLRAQGKILLEYLSRNRNTKYGRQYSFSSIKTITDYQARVPLCDSETVRPLIKRMSDSEDNILTADKVRFFGSTSGTTSTPKFIPTTKFSESKKAQLLDLWSYYIVRDHPDVLDGKILAIISPEVEGHSPGGIPFGAESGHGYKSLPGLVKDLYVLPYEVFEIKDYEARYYAILRMGMGSDVTDIATLNPNTLILLAQKIAKWQEMIISDIEKGGLNGSFSMPQEIRNRICRRLAPDPVRAGELKAILNKKGTLLPKYFWPNMKLIECWKGGTMKLYLNELPAWFGPVTTRDIGCLSTEARSSIPMSDEGAGGVLAIQTNFYEFIPKEDMGMRQKKTILCDSIEKGKEYFIIVTTPGGLYRYNIDDIIRVDGFFNKTPIIEFVQKGLNATSIAGEKLYESQLNDALNNVLRRMKIFIEFFCAVAEPKSGSPRYIFLTEFSQEGLGRDEKKRFLKAMDEELCLQNREYEFCRKAQLIKDPVLKVVSKGEFERYRIKRVASGAHDGQFKAPELTADTNFQKNFRIDEEVPLK